MHRHKTKTKVLFIFKHRLDEYGIPIGLINSAKFTVNGLVKAGIDADYACVIDANGIDAEIKKNKPTHVILEAIWVPPAKLEELAKLYHKVKFTVLIHSKAPFLANEGIAMEWIMQYRDLAKHIDNIEIGCNNLQFNYDLTNILGRKTIYLPNIYCPKEYNSKDTHNRQGCEYVDIACFGAVRSFKNHLNQAIAAIEYARSTGEILRFHINATRQEQQGNQVLKNLRGLFGGCKPHQLVEHGWMHHERYINLVRAMDIGMQVSFTESFNIVAADFAYHGVPIIVSPEISWASRLFQTDPNNVQLMVSALCFARSSRILGLQWLNYSGLKEHNIRAVEAWKRFLP